VGNHFHFDFSWPLNLCKAKRAARLPDNSKIKFGEPLPGFLFKPSECIINSHWAEAFRQGLCTQQHFDGMKMLVVEVGNENESKAEGYRLSYQLPGTVDHPSKMIVQWRLRIYVESNFELCAPSGDLCL